MKRSVGIAKKLNNKKKKIIIIGSIFLIFVISIITLITTGGLSKLMGNSVANLQFNKVIIGDFNLDGNVNWDDYYLLAQYNTNLRLGKDVSNFSEEQLVAGDVNNDGITYYVDQMILRSFLDKTGNTHAQFIGKSGCGRYYYLDPNNANVCKKTADETYKNNHFINDTYKLGDINLKFNESFILKNDVKYRKTDFKSTNKEISNMFAVFSEVEEFYSFKYSIVHDFTAGYDNQSYHSLCYENNDKTLTGYLSDELCQKYGYVQFGLHDTVYKLFDPGHQINVMNYFELDRYSLTYYDDYKTVNYIKKDQNVKIKDNTEESAEDRFIGWYAERVIFDYKYSDVYYCYTSPSKEKGWTNKEACEQFGYVLFNPGDTVKNLALPGQGIIFHQKWVDDSYTIHFKENGGSGRMDSQTIKNNTKTKISKNQFMRSGYDFIGWNVKRSDDKEYCYTSASKTNASWSDKNVCDTFGRVLISDGQELYKFGSTRFYYNFIAQWKKKSFTVKFNSNGGTGSMKDQTIQFGVNTTLNSNSFIRNGYAFAGWVAQREDGLRYCYTTKSKTTADWVSANTCANNGYYIFSNKKKINSIVLPGKVVTMYAQWNPTQFTVKFNSNGANGKMADQQMTYGGRNKLNSNTFTKSGYVFNGWVAQRWDGLKYCYTSPSKVAADWVGANTCKNFGYYIFANNIVLTKTVPAGKTVTMFAQWKTNQFTVRFNSNGGSGSMSEQKMTYGVKNTLKSNAYTKSGYVFNGWVAQRWDDLRYCYTSPSKTSAAWLDKNACANNGYYIFANNIKLDTTVPAGRVVTMYAQWKTNQFTVRFNSNGGSGSMSEQKMTYGVKNTLKSNAYKKNGYIFTGWIAQRWDDLRYCYTSPSQTSAAWLNKNTCANNGYYIFANNIKLDTTVPAGRVVTMYAQWKSDQYTIRYYAGGGTGEMSDQKTSYNTTIKLNPNRFTRSGYEFIGWNIQRGDEWYCYTSPSRTQTAWSKTNVCENNGYYLYHDKQSVSKMTSPGKVVRAVAQWRSTHYTIRYYPSGGSGTMKDQKVDYSSAASLSKNNFTRKNYKFIGWHAHRVNENTWKCYTSPSKTKTAWLPKNTCENNGYYLVPDKYNILYFAPKNTVVNMYAQWKKN